MEKKGKEQFLSLIIALHTSAMQYMGKLKSPLTGKIERNLDIARETIDTIEAIKIRTEGNLDDDEERFINNLLTELRLNFIGELEKKEEVKEEEKDKEEVKEKEEKPDKKEKKKK
ncbi:MAG: DUF1844 domain-containing protein [bacterium]